MIVSNMYLKTIFNLGCFFFNITYLIQKANHSWRRMVGMICSEFLIYYLVWQVKQSSLFEFEARKNIDTPVSPCGLWQLPHSNVAVPAVVP